ncbi:MAG: sirohydrochlorin chelatase [Synechococcales cyanobacterium]
MVWVALVAHGSRDPRYQAVLAQLVQQTQMVLAPIPVRGVVLETDSMPLAAQLLAHQQQLEDPEITVVPLFMGSGIHLTQDLPEQLQQVSRDCPQCRLRLTPTLGSRPEMVHLWGSRLGRDFPWVMVAHGSRRADFANEIQQVVREIGHHYAGRQVLAAFLTQPPTLADHLTVLYERGYRQVGIQPYVLFPGSILETMHAHVQQWQAAFPPLHFTWGSPLAPDPAIVTMIQRLVQDRLDQR